MSPPSREEEGVEAPAGVDYIWIGGGGSGGASATISPGVGIIWIACGSG